MRGVAVSCLLVLPGCLLLLDRPTGTEEEEATPMIDSEESSDGEEAEPACIDYTAQGLDVVSGSTLGAADDIDGCGIGGDAVISWGAPSTDVYTFSVSAGFDSIIGVDRPSCGSSPLECVDDCNGIDAAVEYSAERGEELFIVIESYSGGGGSFTLSIARDYLYCDYSSSSGSSSSTSGYYGSTSW
jgi:hypothetical protein